MAARINRGEQWQVLSVILMQNLPMERGKSSLVSLQHNSSSLWSVTGRAAAADLSPLVLLMQRQWASKEGVCL